MKRLVQLILAIAIGIARDQRTRRRAMFFLTLAALVMLFLGTTILWSAFVSQPLFFAIYWLVCTWITICVILVAIYDLLLVIRADREAKRAARREMTGRKD